MLTSVLNLPDSSQEDVCSHLMPTSFPICGIGSAVLLTGRFVPSDMLG